MGKQVPLTTAWSVIVPHGAFVSARTLSLRSIKHHWAGRLCGRAAEGTPPNTYEASPCQVGKQAPLTTALSVIVPHCAFVSASHSVFASTIWCSVLDSAPNTYRGSHATALGESSGETIVSAS